jgi:hypothetical protein
MGKHNLTRRHFLKAAGIGAAAAAGLNIRPARAQSLEPNNTCGITYDYEDTRISFNELYDNPPMFGRVHGAYHIRIFEAPSREARTVCSADWGFIMPLYRGVQGTYYDARATSTVWFETDIGYVHSAYVVPCHEKFQDPFPPEEFPGEFWGEVMVPLSWQFWRPNIGEWDYDWYKCVYSQVHKVLESTRDDQGEIWYRLFDDVEDTRSAWVLGKHIRYIDPDEFAPISPDVQDKKIIISLPDQTLTAYENDVPVFRTRIASGTSIVDDEGNVHDFATLEGDYLIERKRPSRRMRGGDASVGTHYDVNAVPWCTYFGGNNAAIHGAYWHNNYGTPRSHGCINVTPDAAKWVYRWTAPHYGYDIDYQWRSEGERSTRIIVV